jgi:outer membrane protein TolC
VRASAAERQRYEYEAQQARRRQTQGVISALDVDDALLRLGVARFNEQQALYDYAVARVAMDKAMGGA